MDFHLGVNLGFAVNRFPEPEEWSRIVGQELEVRNVQFTADLLNPDLPSKILDSQIRRTLKSCQENRISIRSTFTGAFTRVNHLAHPDAEIRQHWLHWFKRFVDLSVDLGAVSMGSHFGIFSAKDNESFESRETRRKQNIEGWHQIADYAKERGLQFLSWEPMSISREQGETLEEARRLQDDVNRGAALPFFLCLDVDHGDVLSPNPDDTNPYVWLQKFANEAPLIHLKQSSKNKGGHWPFTAQHNAEGKINPSKVLEAFKAGLSSPSFDRVDLLLELSFREREPMDSSVIPVMKESVNYWRSEVRQ